MDVLESGDIYFVYLPRIEHSLVFGLNDVQRLLVLLEPSSGALHRRLVIGRKRLPDPGNPRQRFWACVDRVGDADDVTADFDGGTYSTATRGERYQGPARPAGVGRYVLGRHGDHTHLAYALELPQVPGDAQRALRIAPEASYIVAVANPERGRGPGRRRRREVTFPRELQERFRERRFASVDPPAFLDVPGAELVLIGAREEAAEAAALRPERQPSPDEVAQALRLRSTSGVLRPLVAGQWS